MWGCGKGGKGATGGMVGGNGMAMWGGKGMPTWGAKGTDTWGGKGKDTWGGKGKDMWGGKGTDGCAGGGPGVDMWAGKGGMNPWDVKSTHIQAGGSAGGMDPWGGEGTNIQAGDAAWAGEYASEATGEAGACVGAEAWESIGKGNKVGAGHVSEWGDQIGVEEEESKFDAVPTAVPEVKSLTIAGEESKITSEGYDPDFPAIAYYKDPIFSSAHYVLQELLDGADMSEVVDFHHDPYQNKYREVYRSWKNAGGETNCCTIALCKKLNKWAVGLGGKANAARAAKLALALTIAADADETKLAHASQYFPGFRALCSANGIDIQPVKKLRVGK